MVRDSVQAVSKQAQSRQSCEAPGATARPVQPCQLASDSHLQQSVCLPPSPLTEAWNTSQGTHTWPACVWSLPRLSTANCTDKATVLPTGPGKGIGSESTFLQEVIDSLVILYGMQKGTMKYAREVLSENVKKHLICTACRIPSE